MSAGEYHPRPIRSLLIANRGEIAIRILQACHELPNRPTTYAVYTDNDTTHVGLGRPDHAVRLSSPSSYMDIDALIKVVKEHQIDTVHPGYGFLSENPNFVDRLWHEANCMVVGPGRNVLERTGDKLEAKALAAECDVPTLKSMMNPTSSIGDVQAFANSVGLPIMIKAIDGGGGRGIRLVTSKDSLQGAVERCIGESPSKSVFAEQAAVNGFKHIEIQIIGDGNGNVRHLWERDCSVQRRFQKIVEVAPTPTDNRQTIAQVISAATRMAEKIKYLGLGTFEFLVNAAKGQFFFLEINPRLQVEHTISESISGIDLVKEQLLIAQGLNERLTTTMFATEEQALTPPNNFSIQFRLCAEDPNSNFSLSIGKVSNVNFPTGNGIRVDSHLSKGGVVGADFDNLMAKIIVTAPSWEEVVLKSRRALSDTLVEGVKTNIDLLRAIVADSEFQSGQADTQWLEKNIDRLVRQGQDLSQTESKKNSVLPPLPSSSGSSSTGAVAGAITSFRKGDAWSLHLKPAGEDHSTSSHLRIEKIARNEFPEALTADISYTLPGQQPHQYTLHLTSTTASSNATSSSHRKGDPANKSHIVLPMGGKLVEVLVQEGDYVTQNQVVGFVKQMKMELEIRSQREGRVKWVVELENEEDGDDVAEGVLIAELEVDERQQNGNDEHGNGNPGHRGTSEVKSRL